MDWKFNKHEELEFRTIARQKTKLSCKDNLYWKLMDRVFCIDKNCVCVKELPSIKITYSVNHMFTGVTYDTQHNDIFIFFMHENKTLFAGFDIDEFVKYMLLHNTKLSQRDYNEILQLYATRLYNEITHTRKRKKDFLIDRWEEIEKSRLRMLEILSLYLELKTKQLKNNNHGE